MDSWPPRVSSTHQKWPHLSPYASPVVETAGPSQTVTPHSELAVDESARAYRTSALRQLNRNPARPLSRKPRQGNQGHSQNQSNGRSSMLASQPVLVRTYSGPSDGTGESSKMSSKRGFSFTGSSKGQSHTPQLPSAEDFSIDSILRVIEPDIRGTLDSIAEICGRSKMSLANEYGSHIAPLGEIRAPPGGLLTVEEASPSHEGELDDNVIICDDDNSVMDGREHEPAYYGYFEDIGRRMGNSVNQTMSFPDMPVLRTRDPRPVDSNTELYSFPAYREAASRSKSRALMGKMVDSHNESIQTQAVVSEVHLDARANGISSDQRCPSQRTDFETRPAINRNPPSQSLQALFSWLRQAPRGESSQHQTAEMRLREMLERQASQNVAPAIV